MSSAIASRLLEIIEKTTVKHRRNKQLAELTGIDSERWSAFSLGRQRPTAEMLEGIAKAFPVLCLWLMTGSDDRAHGQYDIDTYVALKKFNLNDILAKEPVDLTAEELLVVDVEGARSNNPDYTARFQLELLMIDEARQHNLTRSQVLEKWRMEQQRRLAEALKDDNQAG